MYICIYKCICIYVHMYVYVHVHSVCVCVRFCVFVTVCTCMFAYACVCACVYVGVWCVHVYASLLTPPSTMCVCLYVSGSGAQHGRRRVEGSV